MLTYYNNNNNNLVIECVRTYMKELLLRRSHNKKSWDSKMGLKKSSPSESRPT